MKMESKIPFYNIVNILLTGLVFTGSCCFIFLIEMQEYIKSVIKIGSTGLETLLTIACFAIAYEVGYVIFRLGAVLIEPIAKRIFKFVPYTDFISAQKVYPKLEDLSREYGYARTRIALFSLISIVALIKLNWLLFGISIAFVLLFIVTLGTHTKKIRETVEKYLSEADGQLKSNSSSV